MRPRNCLKTLDPLLKKAYFSSEEARKLGVHPSVLSYYTKTGHLKRIRRGVYQAAHYENPSAFRWEDLTEAVYSVKGGIICLTSALAIYELTDEIPRKHWIAVQHNTSIKAPKQTKIVRMRNVELGKTTIVLEETVVSIFDIERTIIDSFRLLSREAAVRALKEAYVKKGNNRLDLVKLEAYAKELRFNIEPYLLSITA